MKIQWRSRSQGPCEARYARLCHYHRPRNSSSPSPVPWLTGWSSWSAGSKSSSDRQRQHHHRRHVRPAPREIRDRTRCQADRYPHGAQLIEIHALHAGGHNQAQGPVSQPDPGNGTAIEIEPVLLHTVTEDDTILGHVRGDFQRLILRDGAVHDFCARGLAHERLANAEDQTTMFPRDRVLFLNLTDLGRRDVARNDTCSARQNRPIPARGTGARGDDQATGRLVLLTAFIAEAIAS